MEVLFYCSITYQKAEVSNAITKNVIFIITFFFLAKTELMDVCWMALKEGQENDRFGNSLQKNKRKPFQGSLSMTFPDRLPLQIPLYQFSQQNRIRYVIPTFALHQAYSLLFLHDMRIQKRLQLTYGNKLMQKKGFIASDISPFMVTFIWQ